LAAIDPEAEHIERHVPSASIAFLKKTLKGLNEHVAMMQYKDLGDLDLLKGMATVIDDLKAHAVRAEQLASQNRSC
jgi:hypothetical protein